MVKLLTPKEIIRLEYESIEKSYKNEIETLGWGEYTDVLYSFLGVFTLGIYIFEKDKSKYSIGEDNIIRIKGTKQWLGSRNYVKKFYPDFMKISSELQGFANVYTSIGNVVPIWPGGNEFKGKDRCYDIPDIFFYKYSQMEEMYVRHILNKELTDVALTRLVTDSPYIDCIEKVLNYTEKDYRHFVQHIVDEINKRNEEIKEILK